MLAAARALLGRKPGFAAILGTGTNSCIYDGEKITYNVDSLGFYDHNNVSFVVEGFETFFQNLVVHYPNYQDYSFTAQEFLRPLK